MNDIHNANFGIAAEKIKIYQDAYKKKYDKKNKTKKFSLRKGSAIQVRRRRSKQVKGSKNDLLWIPRNAFYTIVKIEKSRKKVTVKNPSTGKILKKTFNFDVIRRYRGN